MTDIPDLTTLPDNLPAAVDDGAANHLPGLRLPALALASTSGQPVDLSRLTGRVVLYCYPMTGRPGIPLPAGWDMIPGARGCTPQACAFRDHHAELRALHAAVYGLSVQPTTDQQEAVQRLHLPFPLLSDESLAFARALRLPTFTVEGRTLLKRVTLILRAPVVEHVFYPVFPPDRSAQQVIDWLRVNPV